MAVADSVLSVRQEHDPVCVLAVQIFHHFQASEQQTVPDVRVSTRVNGVHGSFELHTDLSRVHPCCREHHPCPIVKDHKGDIVHVPYLLNEDIESVLHPIELVRVGHRPAVVNDKRQVHRLEILKIPFTRLNADLDDLFLAVQGKLPVS